MVVSMVDAPLQQGFISSILLWYCSVMLWTLASRTNISLIKFPRFKPERHYTIRRSKLDNRACLEI